MTLFPLYSQTRWRRDTISTLIKVLKWRKTYVKTNEVPWYFHYFIHTCMQNLQTILNSFAEMILVAAEWLRQEINFRNLFFKEKSNRGEDIILHIYCHVSETDIGIKTQIISESHHERLRYNFLFGLSFLF